MPKKVYCVDLTEAERAEVLALTTHGARRARMVRRAQTLLLADEGKTDAVIAAALHVGAATVQRTRQRFVEEGLAAALRERPRPGGAPKLTADQAAVVVALACSPPPAGRRRWTLQLLAQEVVTLAVVDAISDETIRTTLKKTRSSPGSTAIGACPMG